MYTFKKYFLKFFGKIPLLSTGPPYVKKNFWEKIRVSEIIPKSKKKFLEKFFVFIGKEYNMGKFIITEQERKHIMGLYEQVSGSTSSGTTLNTPQAWGEEIKRVQREIGNPSTWTMDSYNRLQKLKTVKESRYRMGLYESVIVKSPNEDEWCKTNITDKTNQVCVVKTPDTGDKEICRKKTGDFVKSKGYVNNIKIEIEGDTCRTIWEKIK